MTLAEILAFFVFCVSVGLAEQSVKLDADVIVVGGGLAGLSAVLSAVEQGARKVLLVDGEKNLGGNSMKASSGINGCGTEVQKKLGIEDTPSKCFSDTVAAGDGLNIEALVDVLVQDSASAIDWLRKTGGVPLDALSLCGGHSVKRTHWLPIPEDKTAKPMPVGVAIMRALIGLVEKKHSDTVTVMKGVKVTELLRDNRLPKSIGGIRGKSSDGSQLELRARAVVLTTGGFSAAREGLLAKHAPAVSKYPTTNGGFAQGDGIQLGVDAGAGLVGMQHVQIHPTAFIDPSDPAAQTKFLAAEALRGSGALLLSETGERFANELGRRDMTTAAIEKYCAKEEDVGDRAVAFLIMNEAAIDKFGWPAFNFYWKIKKFFLEFDSAKSFAAKYQGITLTKLEDTFKSYNSHVTSNAPDAFGKTVFPVPFSVDEKIWVSRITPALHYTMGGLRFDTDSRVLSEAGDVIDGLYAAGEVTGGVHGANRLGGNSLLECVVFGRRAGQNAAKQKGGEGEKTEL